MLQLLPQKEVLIPRTATPKETVECINSYIEKFKCENLDVDISFMNIMDACYVSTVCSTTHYIKHPDGKINWIISSKLTEEFNKPLELGNSEYHICS